MRRFFLAMVWAWPLAGCSAVMCAGDGVEVNQDFTVLVRHQDKGLPNVQVDVSGPGGDRSSVTGADGSVRSPRVHIGSKLTIWGSGRRTIVSTSLRGVRCGRSGV